MLQQLDAFPQRVFLIRLPEKTRVVEPRPQYTLMSMPDDALRITISIQHRQKIGGQLAIRIFHRKILLVVTHDRDQYFLRQFQEFRVETS